MRGKENEKEIVGEREKEGKGREWDRERERVREEGGKGLREKGGERG